MAILVDTNILVRFADLSDPFHLVAKWAVAELHRRGELLHVIPQNLVEFRNVATRPKAANGLGLSVPDAIAKTVAFEAAFPLLAETPGIYPAWQALTAAAGVMGKQVHDARLVAVCHVYGVTHLLTFNLGDFIQMAAFGPGIIVVHPSTV
jgi:predicted nucleic acid-binding protein